jgi:hypothetical protein
MNNIGRLTTFARLINDESVIIIPKVQRDYAYGRKDEKIESIAKGMLDTMFDAILHPAKEVILDFVYGGTYIKTDDSNSGFIPLDGQQRLTTLFLLHVFASIVENGVTKVQIESLKKFRYETRQSATDFCSSLIEEMRDNIIKKIEDKENGFDPIFLNGDRRISQLIRDDAKYLPSYDTDPTIQSMLNVMDYIEDKYRKNSIDNMWTRLVTQDNIRFYSLSLEDFGLTDDLYLKMNSRGKRLTKFEIFKSDIENTIHSIDMDLEDEISHDIDNQYMDVLWKYANEDVLKADNGMMQLFSNIFRIELYRRSIETNDEREARLEEIITDKKSVQLIKSYLDVISNIENREGLKNNWNKYFYFSDDAVGIDGKLRLFWKQERDRKSVFMLATERKLSVPELCYFYALYLVETNHIADDEALRRLRIVRNLVTGNTRANSAHHYQLKGFLEDITSIVRDDIVPDDTTFVKTNADEEKAKLALPINVYEKLLRYENHNILQGSLALFMEKYSENNPRMLSALSHFEELACNGYSFDDLRIALLCSDGEYMPYETSWEDLDHTKRFFMNNKSKLDSFFAKSGRIINSTILDIIETIQAPIVLSELVMPNDVNSWKYYMCKYSEVSINLDTQGVYAWDDKRNKPLEIIILNSKYHSEYNLEWKMLNYILWKKLNDNDRYQLDPHASSPLSLPDGITMTITQDGWLLEGNVNDISSEIARTENLEVIPIGEDLITGWLVKKINSKEDYVEFGLRLVRSINAIVALKRT